MHVFDLLDPHVAGIECCVRCNLGERTPILLHMDCGVSPHLRILASLLQSDLVSAQLSREAVTSQSFEFRDRWPEIAMFSRWPC